MTDEKMAINWIRSQGWSEENLPCDELLQMETAYLAGLKAGTLKWHKVADGDMPKEEGEYLVCYACEGGFFRKSFILNYTEYDDGLHWYDDIFKICDEGVIAWCEIPTYTEE